MTLLEVPSNCIITRKSILKKKKKKAASGINGAEKQDSEVGLLCL